LTTGETTNTDKISWDENENELSSLLGCTSCYLISHLPAPEQQRSFFLDWGIVELPASSTVSCEVVDNRVI